MNQYVVIGVYPNHNKRAFVVTEETTNKALMKLLTHVKEHFISIEVIDTYGTLTNVESHNMVHHLFDNHGITDMVKGVSARTNELLDICETACRDENPTFDLTIAGHTITLPVNADNVNALMYTPCSICLSANRRAKRPRETPKPPPERTLTHYSQALWIPAPTTP